MKATVIKTIILFMSIPLINSIGFGLGTLVHDMHYAIITEAQYEAYQESMMILISITGGAILLIETLHDYIFKNDQISTILYLILFVVLAVVTRDQFIFRPFEHSLTFASIFSVVITRLSLNKRLVPVFANVYVD